MTPVVQFPRPNTFRLLQHHLQEALAAGMADEFVTDVFDFARSLANPWVEHDRDSGLPPEHELRKATYEHMDGCIRAMVEAALR